MASMFIQKPFGEIDRTLSKEATLIHVSALDGLVNVNSLFSVAVFVGLSFASPRRKNLTTELLGACDAGEDIAKNLVVFQVVSFSSFLFSSLVAQGLKLAIILNNSEEVHDAIKAYINNKMLRLGMLASAAGSVLGCVFLLLSMVNVIQISLGVLSCGGSASVKATLSLVALVTTALLLYISTVFYAFTH